MAKSEAPRFRYMPENTDDEILLTSDQKAAWTEEQIRQATLGNLDSIACPYCGSNVVLGVDELCCKPMDDVTATLLDRMEGPGFEARKAGESSKAVAVGMFILRSRTTIQ